MKLKILTSYDWVETTKSPMLVVTEVDVHNEDELKSMYDIHMEKVGSLERKITKDFNPE